MTQDTTPVASAPDAVGWLVFLHELDAEYRIYENKRDAETAAMERGEVAHAVYLAQEPPVAGVRGWQPISTAPRDGVTYFLATNGSGVWMAHWCEIAVSGFRFDNPWRSVMLNHRHIRDETRRYGPPTHWMPLPDPPAAPQQEQTP